MCGKLMLPLGWRISEPFSEQSQIVNVAAGAGVGTTVQQSVLSKVIPSGARAYVSELSFRIVDMAAFDQVYFSLKRNGARIAPWEKISGEQVVDEHIIPVDYSFEPGFLEIAATNISGTSETGASENAGTLRVIARFKGYLLVEDKRR
jgi:hypothetical protein